MSPSALWVEGARLAVLLGDRELGPQSCHALMRQPLVGVQMDLTPGDVLHVHGSVSHYAYVLESGLVQCHDPCPGLGLPVSINFAGADDWIGLCDRAGRHQQTVRAVTHASVLAFSSGELRALSHASPSMAAMLARRAQLALAREIQVVHRLACLSPHERTVAGLMHLVALCDPAFQRVEPAPTLRLLLDVTMLSGWLGVPLPELQRCLGQLRQVGAVNHDDLAVHALVVGALSAACASEPGASPTMAAGTR